jgi:hypothetical protein
MAARARSCSTAARRRRLQQRVRPPDAAGYFRSFELPTEQPGVVRAYDKPIMLAGGLGAIDRGQVQKLRCAPGDAVDRARRPGDADRPRRRRRVVGGVRAEREASISPRCSATTPRWSAAARK